MSHLSILQFDLLILILQSAYNACSCVLQQTKNDGSDWMKKKTDFDPYSDEVSKLSRDTQGEGYIFESKILDVDTPRDEFRLVAQIENPEDFMSPLNYEEIEPEGIASLQAIIDQIVNELPPEDLESVEQKDYLDLSCGIEKALILKTALYLGNKWNAFAEKNSRMESMFFEEIDCLIGLSMSFGKALGDYNSTKKSEFFYTKGIKYHKVNLKQSLSGSFNKSKYYDVTMKIARATWEQYPQVTVAALASRLSRYLEDKYPGKDDLPSKMTIEKTWLYKASFKPDVRSKRSVTFDLIT
ncbi:hypothetical protein ECB94_04695 [Vibrio mediterranei]|uniref:Uncharacterized protein n=2 Tax=Vibrio mediterranei TaxID=689 RepID=A0A3G4V9X8_9VIBR|nr:hypothetical protein ECB94_04695 [Vibrio mediterranei]